MIPNHTVILSTIVITLREYVLFKEKYEEDTPYKYYTLWNIWWHMEAESLQLLQKHLSIASLQCCWVQTPHDDTVNFISCIQKTILNWLIDMLLVSRSGLVKENAVEEFHHYGVHLSSSFLKLNVKSFQGK
jgi:hypothetical protein